MHDRVHRCGMRLQSIVSDIQYSTVWSPTSSAMCSDFTTDVIKYIHVCNRSSFFFYSIQCLKLQHKSVQGLATVVFILKMNVERKKTLFNFDWPTGKAHLYCTEQTRCPIILSQSGKQLGTIDRRKTHRLKSGHP